MKILLWVTLCLFPILGLAQSKLQGKVTDKSGQPIFAANVYVQTAPEKGVATDFDGNFSLKITDENDVLIVSFVGYQTRRIPLKKLEISKFLTIKLKQDSQSLSEIIIMAKDPISEKFSVTKIKKLDVYFNPVSQGDPLKAITILPASTTVDETANPSLRGSSPDRTRVMLNGVPIYTPVRSSQLNNQGFFSLFNTELIDKQYVYASNPPLTYGNTSAGLVEIQTLTDLERNRKQLSVGIGGVGFFVSQKIQPKRSFVQLYGNLQKSDAFIGMQKKNFEYLKAFNTKDVGLNFHQKIGGNVEINSFSYYVAENFKVNYPSLNYIGEANANKQRFFTVNNLKYFTSKGVFSINSGFNTSKQYFNYGNITSNKKVNQLYASLNFKGKISDNIDVQTGISYDVHRNKFNDTIPIYYFAISPKAPSESSKKDITNTIAEAYVYTDWEISDALTLSAGARSNLPISKQSHYLNAQLGAKYQIDDKNDILLSGGSYHSYSTPNYYSKQFTLLSSKQVALDYTYTAKKFRAKAAAYYKKEDGEQTINSYFTIDKTQTFGIEAYVEYSFAKGFKLTASNLFIDQKLYRNNQKYNGEYNFNYLTKIALQYSSLKLFTASISYIGRPGKYHTPIQKVVEKPSFEYLIPVFSDEINSGQYSAYNKIDFTINRYTPLKNGAIIPFLSVTNIFNIKNESGIYYNADYSKKHKSYYGNRVIYFGVIWEF